MWWLKSPRAPAWHHIWCGDGRVITAAGFDARKAFERISRARNATAVRWPTRNPRRTCSGVRVPPASPGGRLARRSTRRPAGSEIGLMSKPRPRLGGGVRPCRHHLHGAVRPDSLAGRMPDRFELVQSTVSTPDVVLVVVERGPPARPFELVTIERHARPVAASQRPATSTTSTRRPTVCWRCGEGTVGGEYCCHVTIVARAPCAKEEGQPCEFITDRCVHPETTCGRPGGRCG